MDAYSMHAHHSGDVNGANATTAATHKAFFDRHHGTEAVEFVVFNALVLYNVLELLILTFSTFRRFAGWYFWSMLAAILGIFLYTVGSMSSYYDIGRQVVGLTLRAIGWPAMITGQSFVLYSRLSVMFMGEYQNIRSAMCVLAADCRF